MSRAVRLSLAVAAATFVLFQGGYVVHAVVLSERWLAVRQALGLRPLEPSASMLGLFALADLGRALLALGIVNAVGARVACPKARALLSGAALWAIAGLLPRLAELPIDVYPAGFLLRCAAYEAPAMVLAAGVIVASSPAPAASCAEEAAVAERELAEV